MVVDDDESFFCAARHEKKLRYFSSGDNLFHNCAQEDGTTGVPSAFVLDSKSVDGQCILHCFACWQTYFILPTHDPVMYNCTVEINQQYQDGRAGKYQMDHVMVAGRKLTVLDAPCGAGKTYNVAEYVQSLR